MADRFVCLKASEIITETSHILSAQAMQTVQVYPDALDIIKVFCLPHALVAARKCPSQ